MNFQLETPQDQKILKIVENYYSNEFTEEDGSLSTTILPTGNAFLTYFKGISEAELKSGSKFKLQDLIIAGQYFQSYQYNSSPGISLFGITLHPTALYKLLNTDISVFTEQHISLDTILTDHPLLNIQNKIDNTPGFKDKIKVFENALATLTLHENAETVIIDTAIEKIKEQNGCIHIGDLSAELGISTRGLQTKFKKIVGIPPNKYARILRFFYLLKELEASKETFANIIIKYNYFDHSHFTKDYEAFMGKKVSTLDSPHNELFKNYLKEHKS